MTNGQLFESMQHIGDDLLVESETAKRARRPWIGIVAAAACLALIVGVCFAQLGPSAGHQETESKTHLSEPVPGVMVVAGENTPALMQTAEPAVLAWNELEVAQSTDNAMFFALFGQPLTEEELAACSPETRPDGIDSLAGYGLYFGWGQLYCATLTASDPAWDGKIVVQLKNMDAPQTPVQPWDEGWAEEPHVAYLNGQAYRAYRAEYDMYPDTPYVWMSVVFEKGNVEYELTANVPKEAEKQAAADLMYLMLAYTDTNTVPDFSGFQYGEGMSADDLQTE